MEVHHHPKVEKKGFKEFLLEGLMIFFAVFMGFIAENIREHISDSGKEKNYLNSLYIDLKQDSAQLTQTIGQGDRRQRGQDSLLLLLKDNQALRKSSDEAYRLFFKYATSLPEFNATERTFNQLINSGNLRLIGKQKLADSISNYYDQVRDLGLRISVTNSSTMDCLQFAEDIFKLEYGLHPQLTGKTFITYDPVMIEKYRNKLTMMRIAQTNFIQSDLKDLRKSCLALMDMLGKEK